MNIAARAFFLTLALAVSASPWLPIAAQSASPAPNGSFVTPDDGSLWLLIGGVRRAITPAPATEQRASLPIGPDVASLEDVGNPDPEALVFSAMEGRVWVVLAGERRPIVATSVSPDDLAAVPAGPPLTARGGATAEPAAAAPTPAAGFAPSIGSPILPTATPVPTLLVDGRSAIRYLDSYTDSSGRRRGRFRIEVWATVKNTRTERVQPAFGARPTLNASDLPLTDADGYSIDVWDVNIGGLPTISGVPFFGGKFKVCYQSACSLEWERYSG